MKLQYRLQLVINLVACLLLINVSLLGYFQARTQMMDNITGKMDSLVNDQIYQMNDWLGNKTQLVEFIARGIESTSSREYTPATYLGRTNKESELYVAFADGSVIVDKQHLMPDDYDPKVRPWYQHALQHQGVSFTQPFISIDHEFEVAVVQAFQNKDHKVAGVVGMHIPVKELNVKVKDMNSNGVGYGVLISPEGIILAHPNSQRIGDNIYNYDNSTQLVAAIMKGDSHLVRYKDVDAGIYKIMFYKKIPVTGWILGIIVPEEVIYQPLRAFGWRYILINIVAIVLLMLTVFFISRQLTRPLVELTEWAQKLAQGELSFRPRVLKIATNASEDEISKLAQAFAVMSANISLRENQRVSELESTRQRL